MLSSVETRESVCVEMLPYLKSVETRVSVCVEMLPHLKSVKVIPLPNIWRLRAAN